MDGLAVIVVISKPTALVLGTTSADVLVKVPPSTMEIPIASICAGGGSCNCAMLLSRLGIITTLATVVGDDQLSEFPVREAERQGVSVIRTQAEGLLTPRFFGVVGSDGSLQDFTLLHRDCFDQINVKNLYSKLAGGFWDAVIVNSCIDKDLLGLVVGDRFARNLLVFTTNPDVNTDIIFSYRQHIDILFTNEVEFETIARDLSIWQNGRTTPSVIQESARLLVQLGVKSCVVTLGRDGLVWARSDGSCGYLPTPGAISPLSVVGAGDGVVAGAVSALLRHQDFVAALGFGQEVAREVAQSTCYIPEIMPSW